MLCKNKHRFIEFSVYQEKKNDELEKALKNIEELVELVKNRKDMKQMNQYGNHFLDNFKSIASK